MRTRLLLALLSLLATTPLTLAHVPPAPVFVCDPSGRYHDYLPPHAGRVLAADGNLQDCPRPDAIEVGLHACIERLSVLPVVCKPVGTGVEQPLLDYDGDPEHAYGGAVLFVATGDGLTSGAAACHGAPSVGHHAGEILAGDVLGFGPQFLVVADHSRAGFEGSPDCGDGVVEPCDPNPRPPRQYPFPLNVVRDEAHEQLPREVEYVEWRLDFIEDTLASVCNPLDNAYRCASTALAPSRCTPPFGPGADGALHVIMENERDNARMPTAGHVWTG